MVDLRCHGSSQVSAHLPGPHSVEAAAKDILLLLSSLKLFPQVLIGHSLGGKVVMSMAEQFGKRLPRPVQVCLIYLGSLLVLVQSEEIAVISCNMHCCLADLSFCCAIHSQGCSVLRKTAP